MRSNGSIVGLEQIAPKDLSLAMPADGYFETHRKYTRQDLSLAEMDWVVPWSAPLRKPYSNKGATRMSSSHRIAVMVVISLGVLMLAGCSSSPSSSNFQAAIQRNFNQHGPVCMFVSNYPGHDTVVDFMGMNELSQALARAGLFTTTVYKRLPPEKAGFLSPALPARTLYNYKLTALGQKYYSTKNKCFAFQRRVVAVTNYSKQDKRNYQADFTYRYVVPNWANAPYVIDVAKQIPVLINFQAYLKADGKPLKDQAYINLTHNGWRAHFLF